MRRAHLLRIAVPVAVVLQLAGCGDEPVAARDVLLVTIDTLRADLLSAYGHPRRSTPDLDRIAEQGLLFERHYATSPMTGPSHATLFTGLHGSEHGLRKNGYELPPQAPCLAQAWSDSGYQTLAVVGSKVLDRRFGFDRGFDVYDDRFDAPDGAGTGRRPSAERRAGEVVDHALEHLEGFAPGVPSFAWVHVFDPHAPFEAPVALLPGRRAAAAFQGRVEPGPFYSEQDLIVAFTAYEQEIAYTSRELGRLLRAWDVRDRGPASVICITSDHGEGLGEHDYLGHGFFLYEEQLRVPLLLRARDRIETAQRITVPTSAVDVAFTLASLSGAFDALPVPGVDLALLATGSLELDPPIAERPLLSDWDFERPHRKRILDLHPDRGRSRGHQVAWIEQDWKFIWSEDVEPELYDLVSDTREHRNVAGDEPARIAALGEELEAWRADRIPPYESRAFTDEGTRGMLEELGYLQEPKDD